MKWGREMEMLGLTLVGSHLLSPAGRVLLSARLSVEPVEIKDLLNQPITAVIIKGDGVLSWIMS